METRSRVRLAIVISHPIQYYAPWLEYLAALGCFDMKVFYLFIPNKQSAFDAGFGRNVNWDIPLLRGYEYENVGSGSESETTSRFLGLRAPYLIGALVGFKPQAVVVFGYGFYGYLKVAMSGRLGSVPLILRGDSTDLGRKSCLRNHLISSVRSLLFKRYSAFLSVGTANRSFLARHGVPTDKIFYCPHFVDNARFSKKADIDCSELSACRDLVDGRHKSWIVGFVGKLEDKKRPLDLVAAIDVIGVVGGKQVKLVFVGDGVLLSRLKESAGDRWGKSVFHIPFVNQSKMPTIYGLFDLLCLPSSYGETWGLCVNEGMNQGVPAVVSSMVGCGPDLVIPGRTGEVFQSGDLQGLVAAIRRVLLLKASDSMELERNVRSQVALFSMQKATSGLMESVDFVLSSERGG